MNKLLRAFKFYLSVYFSLVSFLFSVSLLPVVVQAEKKVDSATDSESTSQKPDTVAALLAAAGLANKENPMLELCKERWAEYKDLKKDLSEKCGSTGTKDCLIEASKCKARNNAEGSTNNGLQNMMMSLLGGGLGGSPYPVAGGPDASNFSCLTKSNRDEMKSDLKELRTEALDGLDDAREYQRKVADEAKEVSEKVENLKKQFAEDMENAKVSQVNLGLQITAARQKADADAIEFLNSIKQNEMDKVKLKGQLEINQAKIGTLYTETVALCADKMSIDKDSKAAEYLNELDMLQAAVDQEPNLLKKEDIRRKGEGKLLKKEDFFKKNLQLTYGICLKEQTMKYQLGYKDLVNSIKALELEINSKNEENERLNKQLSQIPNIVAELIDGLKKQQSIKSETALKKLEASNQSIEQAVLSYQSKYMSAQTEYAAAQQKLNMQQMEYSNKQKIFQMDTFGDASGLKEEFVSAREIACNTCKNLKGYSDVIINSKRDCPDPTEASDFENE